MRRFRITDMVFKREPEYIEIIFAKWEELGLELKKYFGSGDNDFDWMSYPVIFEYGGFENGFHKVYLEEIAEHGLSEEGGSPGFGGPGDFGSGGSPTPRIR